MSPRFIIIIASLNSENCFRKREREEFSTSLAARVTLRMFTGKVNKIHFISKLRFTFPFTAAVLVGDDDCTPRL